MLLPDHLQWSRVQSTSAVVVMVLMETEEQEQQVDQEARRRHTGPVLSLLPSLRDTHIQVQVQTAVILDGHRCRQ